VKDPADYIRANATKIILSIYPVKIVDLSCKDSSKSEIFAADKMREGQLLRRYLWTRPDLSHVIFRSARTWCTSRLKANTF